MQHLHICTDNVNCFEKFILQILQNSSVSKFIHQFYVYKKGDTVIIVYIQAICTNSPINKPVQANFDVLLFFAKQFLFLPFPFIDLFLKIHRFSLSARLEISIVFFYNAMTLNVSFPFLMIFYRRSRYLPKSGNRFNFSPSHWFHFKNVFAFYQFAWQVS
jgi:hypothetical protein